MNENTGYTDEQVVAQAPNFKKITEATGLYKPTEMTFRRCARCELWWAQIQKWFHYSEGIGRWQSYCHSCRREYFAGREQKRDYRAERLQLHKDAIELLGGICDECGEARRSVLDCHHIDPLEAKEQRKLGWNKRRKWRHVIKFPDRYRLLCKNCHYLEHHPNNTPLD